MTTLQPTRDEIEETEVEIGQSRLSKIGFYLLMTVFALFFLLPLLWMVVTAFKPFEEWLSPNWIPVNPTLENFTSIFNDKSLPILNWFFNSLLIALLFTLAILIIDSLAGYAYARLEFPGKNLLFSLMLATLVMPGIMFLIPNYLTVANLKWIGTIQGVIAPGLAGVFGVFFMRQFFESLPKELEEAAYIDGASVWQTFISVILPLSKGPIITLGIITFLTSWNEFLWSLLILGGKRTALTLPVGLATLQGQYTFDYGKLMAGALVLTIPVLILYAFFQRYIIRSISMTGIKG
ncbi:MAG TPA: carbohydrate ABC transporter permease [Anaerolineales bacterium]|nr:carbohydrate ABC transporter permease [Anaerolineales bacterium]